MFHREKEHLCPPSLDKTTRLSETDTVKSDLPSGSSSGHHADPSFSVTRPSFARILGLETEYAILYQPDDPADTTFPPFTLLEEVLFESILHGRKSAKSSGIKGGYFLENGGLIHLELYVQRQSDTPIIEVATPECSNPDDLVVYQRAFDQILATASDRSWRAFSGHGYRGRIAFGKNNLDSRTTGYGCHENYLVRHDPRWYETLLILLSLPLLALLASPWILCIVLFIVAMVGYGILRLLFAFAYRVVPAIGSFVTDAIHGIQRRIPRGAFERGRLWLFVGSNALLFPFLFVYSFILGWTAYRRTVRQLLPFVVSRQIVAGAGRLNPFNGQFELSQRTVLTRSIYSLVMFGRRKTMFDLKSFLRQPLSIFTSHRRLTLALGDSNLSDIPNLLKLGTTSLILEMIEAGVEFDIELRHPVRANQDISVGGPWKEVEVKGVDRERATALEIQWHYLGKAREYLQMFSSPEEERYHEIVDLWEETLRLFEDDLSELSTRLDWCAKKALIDRAVLPASNWKEFGKWARIIQTIPERLKWKSDSLAEILDACNHWRRWIITSELNRQGLLLHDFARMRELYYQCRKIALRYHEISCDPGYQRQLETAGLVERATEAEVVHAATREPPTGTRARVRGYYIKLSPSPESMYANWGEVRIPGTNRVISLSDPFHSRIPTD